MCYLDDVAYGALLRRASLLFVGVRTMIIIIIVTQGWSMALDATLSRWGIMTPLVGIGRYKISEGTSAPERIPYTSFSKQGHRYGAVYQLLRVGPCGRPWIRIGCVRRKDR
jgi:hypothetical protein